MKVCFPVQQDQGLDSIVYDHFGSAPQFVIVDAGTGDLESLRNGNQHHAKGACNPVQALSGRQVDAAVVGGIGAGALTRLNQLGVRVHRAAAATIRENLALLASGGLPEIVLQGTCGGHGHGGGCSHH